MLTPTTINQCKQNKITQVVRDLSPWVSPGLVYESMLRRGIFKWLANRRRLIKLKNVWRDKITKSIEQQKAAGTLGLANKVQYYRGYRKALEECRADVRALCHSARWQAPDNDELAERWLGYYADLLKWKTGSAEDRVQ